MNNFYMYTDATNIIVPNNSQIKFSSMANAFASMVDLRHVEFPYDNIIN